MDMELLERQAAELGFQIVAGPALIGPDGELPLGDRAPIEAIREHLEAAAADLGIDIADIEIGETPAPDLDAIGVAAPVRRHDTTDSTEATIKIADGASLFSAAQTSGPATAAPSMQPRQNDLTPLIAEYLARGGEVTKLPMRKRSRRNYMRWHGGNWVA